MVVSTSSAQRALVARTVRLTKQGVGAPGAAAAQRSRELFKFAFVKTLR
jgi:hypothetical protein